MDLASPEAAAVRAAFQRGELTREQARAQLGGGAPSTTPPRAPDPPMDDDGGMSWAAMGARVGLPIAGGMLGAIVPIPGASYAGASLGAGLGETLGEWIDDEPISPRRIATQAALGLIPGVKAPGITSVGGRVALRAAEGAAQGAIGSASTAYFGEGRTPSASEIGAGVLAGTVLGGAAGAIEGRVLASRLPSGAPSAAPPAVPTPHVAPDPLDGLTPTARDEGLRPKAAYDPDFPQPVPAAGTEPAEGWDARRATYHAHVERRMADMPQEARDHIHDMIDRHNLVEDATTVESWERQRARADNFVLDMEHLVPQGTALSNNAQWVYGRTGAALGETVARLQQELGQATDPAVIATLRQQRADAVRDFEKLTKIMVGSASAKGRGLQALRANLGVGEPPLSNFLKRASGSGADADTINRYMDAMGADPSPDQMMRALMDLQRPGIRDRKFWRAAMITNFLGTFKTLARNLVGNVVRTGMEPAFRAGAVGVDAVRALATGRPRQTFARELPHYIKGAAAALPEASHAFLQIMRKGYTDNEALALLSTAGNKFDMPMESFGGALKPLNAVSRALRGPDAFFRLVNGAGAEQAEAYSIARRQLGAKATTADLQRVMGETIAKRSDSFLQAVEAAASRSIFTENIPAALAKWDAGIEAIENPALYFGARMLFPFVRVPFNIVRQGAQLTPFGLLSKTARAGDRMSDRMLAETVMGSLALGSLGLAVQNGNVQLRGSAPVDAGPRDAFYAVDAPENAIGINGTWIPFTDFGPAGIALGAVANVLQQKAPMKDEEAWGVARHVVEGVAASGASILDQSFLGGLADIASMARGNASPLEKLERFGQRRVTALVPGQGLLRQTTQAIDPTLRQPRGIGQAIAANIPGLSSRIQPRLNAFGAPVQREVTGVSAFLPAVPRQGTGAPTDPVRAEFTRLGVMPKPTTAKTILKFKKREIPVTPDEDRIIREAQGQRWHTAAGTMIANPGWTRLPEETQRAHLTRLRTQATQSIHARAAVAKARGVTLTTAFLLGGTPSSRGTR